MTWKGAVGILRSGSLLSFSLRKDLQFLSGHRTNRTMTIVSQSRQRIARTGLHVSSSITFPTVANVSSSGTSGCHIGLLWGGGL